jgi:diguanylate cyclase (GGDEF)-like protein
MSSSAPDRRELAQELLAEIEAERKRQSQRPPDLRRDMVELNVLRAFGAAVNERLELTKILDAACQHLPRLLEYACLTILVHVEDKAELHSYPAQGTTLGFVRMSIRNLLDVYKHVGEGGLEEEQVEVWISGKRRDLGPPPSSADLMQSHITLPLVSASETIGAVSVSSPSAQAFGPLDVQLFSLVTHQLSAAVRNSMLLRQSLEQAIRDPLTGVFNRRYFSERVEEELRRAQRYGHPLALVIGDIDHFKQINDKFGHPAGDEVLRCVARALGEELRGSDVLCRFGGEEFVILLPEATTEEAALVAERLRMLVPERARLLKRVKTAVNMSFGVASTAQVAQPSAETLIAQADAALYFAKHSGRNRVCTRFADGALEQAPNSTTSMEQRRFPRVPAELPLRYQVVPDLGEKAPRGRSLDVGAGGFRLFVEKPVPMGTFVLVDIEDASEGRPVRVLAKVVWVREEPTGGATVGARVVSFEGQAEERFERLVQKTAASLPPSPRSSQASFPTLSPYTAVQNAPPPSSRTDSARIDDDAPPNTERTPELHPTLQSDRPARPSPPRPSKPPRA